jgi:D-serine deaminase-like pyridoxal phosphate-dependent protein
MLPSELSTPALVVNLDLFRANVAAAEALVRGTGKQLRPHFKTHRTPALMRQQLGPTTSGVTCATVGEAENLVQAGIHDVLVANEVVTAAKLATLAQLALQARIVVVCDALAPLVGLSHAATGAGTVIDLLIDVDIGLNRCGVRTLNAAGELAAAADRLPGVRLAGLMGYEGRMRQSVTDRTQTIATGYQRLAEVKAALEAAGHVIASVSAAGTSTLREALADPIITEIQAGTYVLMEPDIEDLGLPFRPAVEMIGTVISRTAGQVVLDVGRRSISAERPLPHSLHPQGCVTALNDEHAVLAWTGTLPALGEQVRLRPTQNRITFSLHDRVWLEENGQITACLPISTREKS